MRKLVLMALAGAALMLAVPQFASATPLMPSGLSTAADNTSSVTDVRWRRRCVHRRHWSGRRCW